MLRGTLLGAALLLPACATSQAAPPAPPAATSHATAAEARHDPVLETTIRRLVDGFRGDVGVYVHHLRTGASVAHNADDVFPTASLVKIPILLTLMDQAERGVVDLHARLPYPDTLTYAFTEATDVVGYMAAGDTLPLSQLAFLMLSTSDNHASLWIQALVGGGEVVNRWMEQHGFQRTRVNSRTPGREDARTEFGWGQTTPREIARTLVMMREGRAVSPGASERMYRWLSRTYWDNEAISQLPPSVQAASKQGFVSRSRSEVVLVNAPSGDFVLAVITKNQQDTSYGPDNEGFRLIRAITRAAYEHFEPGDSWRPLAR